MTEREEEADGRRTLALLHQFARHIVDGGDVIGVDGMAKAKTIGEKSRAKEHRKIAKGDDRPDPCSDVEDSQDNIDRDDLAAHILGPIVERLHEHVTHTGPSLVAVPPAGLASRV